MKNTDGGVLLLVKLQILFTRCPQTPHPADKYMLKDNHVTIKTPGQHLTSFWRLYCER